MKTLITDQTVLLIAEGDRTPVIQNLGPGSLYLSYLQADGLDGLKLVSGATYEFLRDVERPLYARAEGTCDVRVMVVA